MSSGFISEADAVEIRKKRQEEWEKVRKPSDPLGIMCFCLFQLLHIFVQV